MKDIEGFRVIVYDKNYKFDHAAFFEGYAVTVEYVNDYIFDGFVVICEEKRILVPDLSNDLVVTKSMGPDTHCYCRDYMANNEVK